MDDVVEKVDGGWRIPLEGFVAASVGGISNTIRRLEAQDAQADFSVPLEMVPEIEKLAAASAVVASAIASDDSTLRVVFEDGQGQVIEIPAGEYEEREVRGPGRINVVAPAKTFTFRAEDAARAPRRS